jgi:hypothetical protein
MASMPNPYDEAERGTERATAWKPSDDDPLRSGRVEQWKLITPRERPDEPVWLLEARDRHGHLWSKFISEAALQAKLIGKKLENADETRAAEPGRFTAQSGDVVAIRWHGKHPHPDMPGKFVTRWDVSIVAEADALAALAEAPDEHTEDGSDDAIPF